MKKLGNLLGTNGLLQNLEKITRKNEYNCNLCEDTQFQEILQDNGLTAMKPCQCQKQIRMDYLNSMIPVKFQGADLATIKPIVEKHVKQTKVIDTIKKNPFASYLFLGTNGAGKTWFGFALFKNAAVSGRRAVAMSMAKLMSEFKRMELGKNEQWKPQVTAEDLSQNHTKWTIFIDEVEKTRVTEFSIEKFYDLVNAANSFGHQLIVTSNMNEDALRDHFSSIDDVWGDSIMRRLTESKVVEMF